MFFVRLFVCNILYGLNESDSGFALYPRWTIPTVLLHLSLNSSGFLFRIPNQRIRSGYRIWPEYRWHALIFVCYTLGIMTVFHMEQHILPQQSSRRFHWINYGITMLVMIAADATSAHAGKYQSRTIRDLNAPPVIKFYFSYAQFFAKSFLLYSPTRRYTAMYFIVFISQLTSFTMTLQRKNIGFSHTMGVVVYGTLLCIGLSMIFHDMFRFNTRPWQIIHLMHATASVAFLLRTATPVMIVNNNKYVIWTFVQLVLMYIYEPRLNRQVVIDDGIGDAEELLYRHVRTISLVAGSLVHIYGYYKLNYASIVCKSPKQVA